MQPSFSSAHPPSLPPSIHYLRQASVAADVRRLILKHRTIMLGKGKEVRASSRRLLQALNPAAWPVLLRSVAVSKTSRSSFAWPRMSRRIVRVFPRSNLLRLVLADTTALRELWTAPAERERRRRFRAYAADGVSKNISCVRKRRGAALPARSPRHAGALAGRDFSNGRDTVFHGARVWWPSAKTPQRPGMEKWPGHMDDGLKIYIAAAHRAALREFCRAVVVNQNVLVSRRRRAGDCPPYLRRVAAGALYQAIPKKSQIANRES
jgi:hypothetical protein